METGIQLDQMDNPDIDEQIRKMLGLGDDHIVTIFPISEKAYTDDTYESITFQSTCNDGGFKLRITNHKFFMPKVYIVLNDKFSMEELVGDESGQNFRRDHLEGVFTVKNHFLVVTKWEH